jgi:hypothetical protein
LAHSSIAIAVRWRLREPRQLPLIFAHFDFRGAVADVLSAAAGAPLSPTITARAHSRPSPLAGAITAPSFYVAWFDHRDRGNTAYAPTPTISIC